MAPEPSAPDQLVTQCLWDNFSTFQLGVMSTCTLGAAQRAPPRLLIACVERGMWDRTPGRVLRWYHGWPFGRARTVLPSPRGFPSPRWAPSPGPWERNGAGGQGGRKERFLTNGHK